MNTRPSIKIELTAEQQAQIQQLTGQQVPAVKLALEPLEACVAPGYGVN